MTKEERKMAKLTEKIQVSISRKNKANLIVYVKATPTYFDEIIDDLLTEFFNREDIKNTIEESKRLERNKKAKLRREIKKSKEAMRKMLANMSEEEKKKFFDSDILKLNHIRPTDFD